MRKALIFWGGFQSRKYQGYFWSEWFETSIVTLSWIPREWTEKFGNFYRFDEIVPLKQNFFTPFDYIIVCVKPYAQQEKVICHLLALGLENTIVIEKPVSHDERLCDELAGKPNVYYFIDETVLYDSYKKFVHMDLNSFRITLYNTYNYDGEDYWDLLEHIFGWLLFSPGFESLLQKTKFLNTKKPLDHEMVYYDLMVDGKYVIHSEEWRMYLNGQRFCGLDFRKSLEYTLGLPAYKNTLLKENFLKLRTFLNKKFPLD